MQNISWFERILLFSAATDPEIYAKCTYSEQSKLLSNGMFVFIPASMAVFSGAYAAPYLFDSPMQQNVFPLAYGLVVYLIDRAIMLHTKPGERSLALLCRIILALLLSFVLAEPLVLHIFRDNIQEEQARQKRNIEQKSDRLLNDAIKPLEKEKSTYDSMTIANRDIYVREADGSAGTGQKGVGKVSDLKKLVWIESQKDAVDKHKYLNIKIDSIRQSITAQKAVELKFVATGLTGAMKTLHQLADSNFVIWLGCLVLRLILVFLDMLPIFLKINPPKKRSEDLYNYLLGKKNDNYFDAANTHHSVDFELAHNRYKSISEHQLHENELVHLKKFSSDMEKGILALSDEYKYVCVLRQETQASITNMVKDNNMRKIMLKRLEEIFDEFICGIGEASKKQNQQFQGSYDAGI